MVGPNGSSRPVNELSVRGKCHVQSLIMALVLILICCCSYTHLEVILSELDVLFESKCLWSCMEKRSDFGLADLLPEEAKDLSATVSECRTDHVVVRFGAIHGFWSSI